jgi:hypothetical protein
LNCKEWFFYNDGGSQGEGRDLVSISLPYEGRATWGQHSSSSWEYFRFYDKFIRGKILRNSTTGKSVLTDC